jgi:hypothetical protein
MPLPFFGFLGPYSCECHADLVHLTCQMRCCFGVLKRGALSHTFVRKLRIAVNFSTPIAEVLTASESVKSFSIKAKWCGGVRDVSRLGSESFWMERMTVVFVVRIGLGFVGEED